MSQENVEIARSIFDRWAEGDFKTDEVLDEHVVLVLRPDFPDAGAHLGRQGVASYMQGFLEPWERITIEAEEIIDAGDTVIVAVCQRGTGQSSGAVTELRYFQLLTFRGGKVIRLESVRERDEAFAAAGLDE
jgi:ketosteroid isomerase-like protein